MILPIEGDVKVEIDGLEVVCLFATEPLAEEFYSRKVAEELEVEINGRLLQFPIERFH